MDEVVEFGNIISLTNFVLWHAVLFAVLLLPGTRWEKHFSQSPGELSM